MGESGEQRECRDVAVTIRRWKSYLLTGMKGMGAKDAVYMLESRGLKVKLEGVGVWFRRASRRTSNIRKGNHTD